MISVFKKQSPIQPSGPHGPGDGSETAPWNWYDIAEGENITDGTILRRDASGAFVRVNLTAGVSYEIFADNSANDSYIMVFYEDENGNMSNASDDDENPGWDCDDNSGDCEYSVRFTFTPEVTGNYIIKYIDYYAQWDGSDNICGFDSAYIKPAPNVVQTSNPDESPSLIYPTSEGFNSLGKPIKHRSTDEAGCALITIPRDGLVFYAAMTSRRDTAETGQQLSYNGTPSFSHSGMRMDSSSNMYTASDNAFAIQSTGTMSFWVSVDIKSGTQCIVSVGFNSISGNEWNLYVRGSSLYVGRSGSETAILDSSKYNESRLYHMVLIADGKRSILYVDGVKMSDIEFEIQCKADRLCVGGVSTHNNESFSGLVSRLRIYNRVLTEKEIKALANESV